MYNVVLKDAVNVYIKCICIKCILNASALNVYTKCVCSKCIY